MNTDNVRAIAMSRRPLVMLTAGAAIVTAATCSSCMASKSSSATAPSAAPTTSAPASTVSQSPVEVARRQATSAYVEMWSDVVAAATTSDWQSPKLGQYATGIALTNLSRGLYADHYNGLVTKGQPVLHPVVSSLTPPNDPQKAIVTDCGDSTHWLKYRADNGQLADDKPGGRQLINAIVEKQADGSWRVSDFGVHDVGTC